MMLFLAQFSDEKKLLDAVTRFRREYATGKRDNEDYDRFLKSFGNYLDIEKPSFRDNINLIYRLDDDTEGEPNRGQIAWSVEPSLEYQLYKNLALRWTAQYQKSRPYNLQQNGFVAFNTGITVRFNFN